MTSMATTTTGLNGSANGSGNGTTTGQSVRLNRVSLDSVQMQGQNHSRQDLFDNPRRMLQTQISQLSSVGDAHSLLEEDLQFPGEPLQRQPTMCSIDELTDDLAISRSRLKLTRITRPPGGVTGGVAGGSKTVAAGSGGVSGDESSGKVRKAKVKVLKSSSPFKGLRTKFNWRARRKGSHKPHEKGATVNGGDTEERAAF